LRAEKKKKKKNFFLNTKAKLSAKIFNKNNIIIDNIRKGNFIFKKKKKSILIKTIYFLKIKTK
jgi:hypothetical protein